jgi:predicted RNA methylase
MWASIAFFTILIIIAISILWTNAKGAPWAPTPMSMVHKMLQMANVGPEDTVYDLGCGDGRLIVTAARRYGAYAVGIELDPLRYLWCEILISILGLRSHVRIIFGDFFKQDLGEADVVTCYLLQRTNKKLQNKFIQELKPKTRIVSHYFTFPKFNLVSEDDNAKLYLYNLKTD